MGIPLRTDPPISHEKLLETLHYDPETGKFTNLKSKKGRSPVGSEAGNVAEVYRQIMIDGHRHRAHQWAWFYMTGDWPTEHIDHRDLDGMNNRWENLRLGTQSQNRANRTSKNPYGKGVRRVPSGRWQARIVVNYKESHIGTYDTKEEAQAAFAARAKLEYGEFYRP